MEGSTPTYAGDDEINQYTIGGGWRAPDQYPGAAVLWISGVKYKLSNNFLRTLNISLSGSNSVGPEKMAP